MKIHYDNYEKPKTWSYIPETYKNQWRDPNKFIPNDMKRSFNQQMYYNFLHRECFNSCLSSNNKSTMPSTQELSCYENCKNKHLSSLGIFVNAILSKRKWDGFLNFINLREYQKDPDEMAKLVPHDPFLRSSIIEYRAFQEYLEVNKGVNEVLNSTEFEKPMSIFEFYLFKPVPEFSKRYKAILNKTIGDYEHYKQLTEKYGHIIKEKYSNADVNDWEGIEGDDWSPESAAAEAPAESED